MLESTRRVDTVLLDKTGTVTSGRMRLLEAVTADGVAEDDLLRLGGALEHASEHPVARAVAEGAAERTGPLPGDMHLHGRLQHGDQPDCSPAGPARDRLLEPDLELRRGHRQAMPSAIQHPGLPDNGAEVLCPRRCYQE